MDLTEKHCAACEGGNVPALSITEAQEMLTKVPGWQLDEVKKEIHRTFEFKGYYKTIAFVNAIAWMTQAEKHHPDMLVSYNQCIVKYTTHAIAGLTINDFICAAKVNEILKQGT